MIYTMDFLSQFEKMSEAANDLERERNEYTKFMKEYWKYALREVKSTKNYDIKWLDSPETRRRKLAEETAENGNQRQKTASRKGRNAAKKAREAMEVANKLQAQLKLRRPTDVDSKNKKGRKKTRLLDNEEPSHQSSNPAKATDIKEENNSSEDERESNDEQTLTQKQQMSKVGKTEIFIESKNNEEQMTSKHKTPSLPEPVITNKSSITGNNDNDKTITSSAVDMFDANGNETIVSDNSRANCPEGISKLKVNTVGSETMVINSKSHCPEEISKLKVNTVGSETIVINSKSHCLEEISKLKVNTVGSETMVINSKSLCPEEISKLNVNTVRSETIVINSKPHCPEEIDKLKMNAVVLLERINLEEEVKHKSGRQRNNVNKESSCKGTHQPVKIELRNEIADCKDLIQVIDHSISSEKTICISEDKNHIPVPAEDMLNCKNTTEDIENEIAKTQPTLISKTSSERWVEKLIKRNENKENSDSFSSESPDPEANKNIEKEIKSREITKKAKPYPLSEPSIPARSRVKEMAQMWENEGAKCATLSKNGRTVKSKKIILGNEEFKENASPINHNVARGFVSSESKALKGRPLSNRNRIYTPIRGKQLVSAVKLAPLKAANKVAAGNVVKRREEEIRKRKQKEEEASKKKEELIKARTEELKRTREFKTQKVFATREAVEKEKLENLAKCEKEKEEREKMLRAEIEKQKEEQKKKKKLINMQKAQEAEERRQREENARLARLREQEEEQKRQAEIKLKQQEEAEKLLQQRKLEEEMRAKEAAKNRKPIEKPVINKNNHTADSSSYDITPHKIEREPVPLIDEENYDIGDLRIEDSEDEDHPKKMIPHWARKTERRLGLAAQCYIHRSLPSQYLVCPSKSPDLRVFFGKYTRYRVRTSSAVWRSPPRIA